MMNSCAATRSAISIRPLTPLQPCLGAKCEVPFTPADLEAGTLDPARCCTSDIALAEYKGKKDASVSSTTTVEEYLGDKSSWRHDEYLYGCPTLVSHAESIDLIDGSDHGFTPELKSYTQSNIAAQL